jgi:protoheme IX farnesyltransferase
MYRIDYKRGGFRMVPTAMEDRRGGTATTTEKFIPDTELGTSDTTIHTDTAGVRTSNIIVRYAWYLSLVPIFTTVMDVTSSMYFLESLLLNTYALRVAYKFRDQQTNQNARSVFITSLWYLPCSLMLFLLHSKAWDDTKTAAASNTSTNMLTQVLSEQIHSIRNRGRELCIHEQAIVKNSETKRTVNITKTNGSIDDDISHDFQDDDGTLSEASCPVMIIRKTDPNKVQLNHHSATAITMAAPQQPSSPSNT